MKDAAKSADIPVQFNRIGSMFCGYFTEQPVHNLADAMKSDRARFAKYFHGMLREGIYLAPSQFEAGFISTAHTRGGHRQNGRRGGAGDENLLIDDMRILALDHGTNESAWPSATKSAIIAQPLEYLDGRTAGRIFSSGSRKLLTARQVGRNAGRHPAQHERHLRPGGGEGAGICRRLENSFDIPIKTWDERLTSVQANRFLIETGMRRDKRKERVDQTAAAILLQSYLDSLSR